MSKKIIKDSGNFYTKSEQISRDLKNILKKIGINHSDYPETTKQLKELKGFRLIIKSWVTGISKIKPKKGKYHGKSA